jgi:hypothetical protein
VNNYGNLCGRPVMNYVCEDNDACGCDPFAPDPCPYVPIQRLNSSLRVPDPESLITQSAYPLEVAAALGAGRGPSARNRPATQEDVAPVQDLLRFLAGLSSVTFDCVASLQSADAGGRGRYEYRAAGDLFRYRVATAPHVGKFTDVEVAYDGDLYQSYRADMGLLSLRREVLRQAPAALPNPLFLPVSFLGLFGDGCPACEYFLSDFASGSWEPVLSRLYVAQAKEAGLTTVLVPGSELEGQPTYYRIEIADGRIVRIWHSSAERDLSRVLLDRYQQAQGTSLTFPHHIVLTYYDQRGEAADRVAYWFERLRFNEPVDSSLFTIPTEGIPIVLDEDGPRFLKHPQVSREEWDPRYRD